MEFYKPPQKADYARELDILTREIAEDRSPLDRGPTGRWVMVHRIAHRLTVWDRIPSPPPARGPIPPEYRVPMPPPTSPFPFPFWRRKP